MESIVVHKMRHVRFFACGNFPHCPLKTYSKSEPESYDGCIYNHNAL
jgi:hypothetical protein